MTAPTGGPSGGDEHPADEAAQDQADLESLYRTLSRTIIPLFFERDSPGNPQGLDREDSPGHANPDPAVQHRPHGDRVRHPLLPAREVTRSGSGSCGAVSSRIFSYG